MRRFFISRMKQELEYFFLVLLFITTSRMGKANKGKEYQVCPSPKVFSSTYIMLRWGSETMYRFITDCKGFPI